MNRKNFRFSCAIAGLVCYAAAAAAAPGRLEHVANIPMEKAREVAFAGERAYVGQNFLGMTVLDISAPAKPTVLRRFSPEQSQPLGLEAVGSDLLVVADRFRGLVLWDISNPDKPTTHSELLLPGIATDVDVSTIDGKRIAGVACGGQGLMVIDITDLTSPTAVAQFNVRIDYSRRLLMHKHAVFLADNFDGGMKLINLSTPRNPQPWYQVLIGGFCEHVELKKDLLSVSYRNYGFSLFKLSLQKESTPSLTLFSTARRSRSRVRTTSILPNQRLVVANDEAGVELYDVANPSLPYLCDEYTFSSEAQSAQSCKFHDGYVYVPCWDGGLNVFRVQDVDAQF